MRRPFLKPATVTGLVTVALLAIPVSPLGATATSVYVSGAQGALSSVSCPSAAFCMAVGWDGVRTIVDTYTGGTWETSTANIGDPTGLSCASATDCIAVGHERIGAYRYDGTNWHAVLSLSNSEFQSVGCAAPNTCTLVTKSSLFVLTGSVPNVVQVTGAGQDEQFYACTSSSYCLGVGSGGQDPQVPSAAVFANGSWSTSPIPEVGFNTQPFAVACGQPDNCTTVGEVSDDLDPDGVAVEELSAGNWSVPRVSNQPASYDYDTLMAVSCSAVTDICTGTGNDKGWGSAAPVYSFIDLGTPGPSSPWTFLMLPATVGQPSASCPTLTSCVAVGVQTVNGVQRTVLQTWDGRAWSRG